MQGVEILNKQIELIFDFWDGKITEDEFEKKRLFVIDEEVDADMQKDNFY